MRKILRLIRNVIFICVIIIIVGAFVFHNQLIDIAKDQAANKIAQTVIDSGMLNKLDAKTSGKVGKVQEIYNNMDSEDKQKVEDIIKQNITSENIKAAQSYVTSGDTKGLEEYAKNKLSDADEKTLEDLYSKYKDQISTQ